MKVWITTIKTDDGENHQFTFVNEPTMTEMNKAFMEYSRNECDEQYNLLDVKDYKSFESDVIENLI